MRESIRDALRARYQYRCGYCGVDETDVGAITAIKAVVRFSVGGCMSVFWSRVEGLAGKALHTRARGKEFEVLEVRPDRVVFVPKAGSGRQRWISRSWLERAVDLGLDESDLRPARLRQEFPNDQNLSYMAAIIHAANA